MNKLFPFIILAMVILCTFLGFRACKQVDAPKTDTLYTVITKLKAIPYHDTIYWEKKHKRSISDSIRAWVQTNPEWDTICQSIGFSKGQTLDCKSILLSRYHGYKSDSIIIEIYQRQRNRDSLVITHYETLDAINRAKLDVCMTEQEKTVKAVKKEVNRKRIFKAIAAISTILIFIK